MINSTPETQETTLTTMDQLFPLRVKHITAIIIFSADEFYRSVVRNEAKTEAVFYCDSVQDLKGLQMLFDLMEIKYSMDS